jgi:hypothetical protein
MAERVIHHLNVPFWTAVGVVVVLYAATFFVLRALIPEQDMAATLAATVLGGGPYVQRSIERRLPVRRGPTVTLAGFQRPWLLLLVVGIVAIWGASSAVTWLQLSVGPITAVSGTIDTLLRLLPPGVALVVGIQVGQRSDRYGLLVVLAAAVAGYLLAQWSLGFVEALATHTSVIPPGADVPAALPPTSVPPGSPPDPRPQYLGEGFVRFLLDSQLPLLVAAAMLGFWRGTRTRLAGYVGSLLSELSTAERQAIVELAHETADARRATAAAAPPTDPA